MRPPLLRTLRPSVRCRPQPHTHLLSTTPLRFNTTTTISPTTQTDTKKPFYITSPIFYVNAAPHVGHLYSMVLADCFKRWELFSGRAAILSTGVDEHGMKIQQAAALAELPPAVFCDKGAAQFKVLANEANINFDHFMRTSDATHYDAVQHFWQQLASRGYIYRAKHDGWYSVTDETFYPSTAVETVVDPATGRKLAVSKETGNTVDWTSEENYHFRLSEFKKPLLAHYTANPQFVLPEVRHRDLYNAVATSLEDLSISRPRERLSWGVPVPGDAGQTIYVWLDALINYITACGYPSWTPGSEAAAGWPADIHIVGKDIMKFHAIYWPAFLLALGLPLPRQVLTHAHWTMADKKMSKSDGTGVNPYYAIARFGVDAMRYFLLRNGRIENDMKYDNRLVLLMYNKELKGGFGNLVNRVCSKNFSIREAIELQEAAGGYRGDKNESWKLDKHDLEMVKSLEAVRDVCSERMADCNVGSALKRIMTLMRDTNQYMQNTAPWSFHLPADRAMQNRRIFFSSEGIRLAALLLQPFMPEKSKTMLDQLAVDPAQRGIEWAYPGVDNTYGAGTKGVMGKTFMRLPE